LERPITQATGHNNNIVIVFEDRVELRSGWQGQNTENVKLRDISSVGVRGFVNVTLTIQENTGRVYRLDRMALPDARRIKSTIEQQKSRTSLYE
jgi:hypothetical protein